MPKSNNKFIQSNTIKRYVKIKKEIVELAPLAFSNEFHSGVSVSTSTQTDTNQTNESKQDDSQQNSMGIFEFESRKWLNSLKFRSIKDLNKVLRIFLIQRFGTNAYDTKSIQELENLDIEFMTRLRACFEIRGTYAIPTQLIWPKIRNSNRTRRYNFRKKNKISE